MDLFNSAEAKAKGIHLLICEVVTVPVKLASEKNPISISFYGNPYQPNYRGGVPAFVYKPFPDPTAYSAWSGAPTAADKIDIWVMHGPPDGRLDVTAVAGLHGCEVQAEKISIARPRLCVFGHYHDSYNIERVTWKDDTNSVEPKSASVFTKEEAVYDFSRGGADGEVKKLQETIFINAAWMTLQKTKVTKRNPPMLLRWDAVTEIEQ
jgi:hypothetical protein